MGRNMAMEDYRKMCKFKKSIFKMKKNITKNIITNVRGSKY